MYCVKAVTISHFVRLQFSPPPPPTRSPGHPPSPPTPIHPHVMVTNKATTVQSIYGTELLLEELNAHDARTGRPFCRIKLSRYSGALFFTVLVYFSIAICCPIVILFDLSITLTEAITIVCNTLFTLEILINIFIIINQAISTVLLFGICCSTFLQVPTCGECSVFN